MEDETGLSQQYGIASPWPLFVALGLTLSEVGVFMGLFPITVGGFLLFGGSVAGILRESGYVDRPWRLVALLGIVATGLGVAVVVTQVPPTWTGVETVLARPGLNGAVWRGTSMTVAGGLMFVGGVAGVLLEVTSTPE